MRIVSNNSEADLARERAKHEAEAAMRELAANVLRIVRGAGAPHELLRQARRLDAAMQAHWDADRTWPFSDIAAAVYLHDKPERWEDYSDSNRAEWYAERQILSGALRQVAGELFGPKVQASHGSTELHGGIRELERVRAEERAQWAAANATPKQRRDTVRAAMALARLKASSGKKPKR